MNPARQGVAEGLILERTVWYDARIHTMKEVNMHVLWGCLIATAGLFMAVCGYSKSEFIVYRLMAARSRRLWGDNVHRFYQIVEVIVIVFGALVALGFI